MEFERTTGGFQVVDSAKNAVDVRTDGWSDGAPAPALDAGLDALDSGPDDVDRTVEGTVESLQFPSVYLVAADVDSGVKRDFGGFSGTTTLDAGRHILRFGASVRVFLRVDGPVEIERAESDGYRLSFSEPTPVTLGFESRVGIPAAEISVPETPRGVATALSMASATTETTSPDRTWPTLRNRSPQINVGEEANVPASLRTARPDTDIDLLVPPDLSYLFTSASLVQYLGASVTVEEGIDPRLLFDGHEEPLGELPGFQEATASLLRRTFFLDCVARGAGPHGGDLAVADTFDTLGLDAARLYDAPLAERLRTYLDVPFGDVSDRFPEWHLGMHVQPTYDHVETLPYLLDNLPHIFLPESSSLSKKEWLHLTVNDGFAKSREDLPDREAQQLRVRREISNVDLVDPELAPARTHGWMAEDVPIDVFKTFPEAYRNRMKYLDDTDSTLSVVAVVNDRDMPLLKAKSGDDAAMRDEHDAAVEHYERRAEELDIDIDVRENVSRAELARIFEDRNDLVHYIGHRDDDGLECADGYFSTTTVEESNAQTFFLNACGSYPEGTELVKRGSVAGGVTYESVPDNDAATVGTAFARLLMQGFCVERAMTKARRQLMTPKDYGVVGDGTHVVTQNDAIVPPGAWLFDSGEKLDLIVEQQAPWYTGGEIRGSLDEKYILPGQTRHYRFTRSEFSDYLNVFEDPIVFEDSLYWPDDILPEI
jgi:hypothetical protein